MIKAGLGLVALMFAAMNSAPGDSGNFTVELLAYEGSTVNGFADPNLRAASCRRDIEFHGAIDKKKTELGHNGLYRWRSLGGVGEEQAFNLGRPEHDKPVTLVVPVTAPLGRSITVTAQLELTKPEHVFSNEVRVTFRCLAQEAALPGVRIPESE
ncbi:MAG: hypothetical protein ACREEP_06670 [Dongiaceae bacterium]